MSPCGLLVAQINKVLRLKEGHFNITIKYQASLSPAVQSSDLYSRAPCSLIRYFKRIITLPEENIPSIWAIMMSLKTVSR